MSRARTHVTPYAVGKVCRDVDKQVLHGFPSDVFAVVQLHCVHPPAKVGVASVPKHCVGGFVFAFREVVRQQLPGVEELRGQRQGGVTNGFHATTHDAFLTTSPREATSSGVPCISSSGRENTHS